MSHPETWRDPVTCPSTQGGEDKVRHHTAYICEHEDHEVTKSRSCMETCYLFGTRFKINLRGEPSLALKNLSSTAPSLELNIISLVLRLLPSSSHGLPSL